MQELFWMGLQAGSSHSCFSFEPNKTLGTSCFQTFLHPFSPPPTAALPHMRKAGQRLLLQTKDEAMKAQGIKVTYQVTEQSSSEKP